MLYYNLHILYEDDLQSLNNNVSQKIPNSKITQSTLDNIQQDNTNPSLNSSTDENLPTVDQQTNDLNSDGSSDLATMQDQIDSKMKYVQQYVLYQNLKQLQYKLDDIDIVKKYKYQDELHEFVEYLNRLLIFFKYFTYQEMLVLSNRLLDEFKKLK